MQGLATGGGGRRIAGWALSAWVALHGGPATAEEEPLTLARATEIALAASPALAASRAAGEVVLAEVAVASARPAPELSLEVERETPHQSFAVSWPLETAGKRRWRATAARAAVATAAGQQAETTAEVRLAVRRAFYLLLAAEQKETETAALQHLAEQALDAARQRFEAGDVARLEVLRSEVAARTAANDARAAAGEREAATWALDALLGRSAPSPLHLAGRLDDGAPPAPALAVAQALANNVELARRDREIAEQRARVALARAQRSPDPALQTVVTHDSQPDFAWGWRLGVSLPLPGRAPRAALAVEELRLAELEAERAAAVARIQAELGSAVALAAALHAQVATLVEEVLPRGEEIATLGLEAYRSGQSDLADLLQTLAARREVALQTIDKGLELQRALADVEQALGFPLP